MSSFKKEFIRRILASGNPHCSLTSRLPEEYPEFINPLPGPYGYPLSAAEWSYCGDGDEPDLSIRFTEPLRDHGACMCGPDAVELEITGTLRNGMRMLQTYGDADELDHLLNSVVLG
jgi:hypothetical protein